MRNLYIIVFLLLLSFLQVVRADSWDDLSNIDRMWDGQKSITNQEFEQVMNALEEKKNKKEEQQIKKKRKKLFGKGDILHKELNSDNDIKELDSLESGGDLLISLPVNLVIDNTILDKGFYMVQPEVDSENNKKFIKFYQSQYYKGRVEIIETQDDFGETELNFVNLLPYNDSFVKIIFGSLDFNGYAYVPYLKK